MSTTLIPLDPAISPVRSTRVLTISANLLPDEVVAARQARRTRGLVLIAVVAVAALCAAWFALAYHQKQEADRDLTEATAAVTNLQHDQREFTETLQVQADTKLLSEQLTAVMANDMDWAALLETLRSAGEPSGITVSGVNGQLNAANGGSAAANVLPGSATDTVGSLLVSGGGPDKKAVAAYVDALGRQTVLANPYVTSVASEDTGGVTFSLRVDIIRPALCGRFTTACTSGGN